MQIELSVSQIVDFIESPVWREIAATIQERIELNHVENDSMNTSWDTVNFNRGSSNELRYMVNLPQLMLTEAKERIEQNGRSEQATE